MRIDGFEMKFVREDDAPKWTKLQFVGVSIRTTDGNDSLLVSNSSHLRSVAGIGLSAISAGNHSVRDAVQFGWDKSFQLLKPFQSSMPVK